MGVITIRDYRCAHVHRNVTASSGGDGGDSSMPGANHADGIRQPSAHLSGSHKPCAVMLGC